MEDTYKTKKNDFISKLFIDSYIFLSEDIRCEPIHLFVSIPIWRNEDNETLDSSEDVW